MMRPAQVCVVLFIFSMVFGCLTYGLMLPSGLFVPCIMAGASIGRLVGATRPGRRRLLLDALARELGDDELRQVERLRASFQTQNT